MTFSLVQSKRGNSPRTTKSVRSLSPRGDLGAASPCPPPPGRLAVRSALARWTGAPPSRRRNARGRAPWNRTSPEVELSVLRLHLGHRDLGAASLRLLRRTGTSRNSLSRQSIPRRPSVLDELNPRGVTRARSAQDLTPRASARGTPERSAHYTERLTLEGMRVLRLLRSPERPVASNQSTTPELELAATVATQAKFRRMPGSP